MEIFELLRILNKFKKEYKEAIVYHYAEGTTYLQKVEEVVLGYIKEEEKDLKSLTECQVYSKKEVVEQELINMIPIVIVGNRN